MIERKKACALVEKHITNKNLIKHALCVEAAMGALAQELEGDVELWKRAGLLHDVDWEATKDNPQIHTQKTIEWLKEEGEDNQELFDALLSHNWEHNGFREPKGDIEWSLYCSDELTGLIVATALVTPEKSLASLTKESILKKFSQKAFAAAVKREQIALCEEKLGIPLPAFIDIVLGAMRNIRKELEL